MLPTIDWQDDTIVMVDQRKLPGQEIYVRCRSAQEVAKATRPTAVNLFWAIDRMKRAFAEGAQAGESTEELSARLAREARTIHDEDVASCRAMGGFGAELVAD